MIAMIKVTRLNDSEFLLNPDLIEFIEETPDTVVSLSTGKKVVVVESAEELVNRIVAYRKKIFDGVVIKKINEEPTE